MIGPQNKVLREDFLRTLLQHLSDNAHHTEHDEHIFYKKDKHQFWYWSEHGAKNLYKSYLDSKPVIEFNNERFLIEHIRVANFPFKITERSYKNVLNGCDQTPIPKVCCNFDDSEDDDSEEEEDLSSTYGGNKILDEFDLLSFSSVTNKTILYDGNDTFYFSQPNTRNCYAGGQFYFTMTFNYSQPDLHIYVELRPEKETLHTAVTGHTGSFFNDQLIRTSKVNSWYPEGLFFKENSLTLMKEVLEKGTKTFKYDGYTFSVIDYAFCDVTRVDRWCGHCLVSCKRITKAEALKMFPNTSSYRNGITISCTPEWYVQYQLSNCYDYGLTARIILDIVDQDTGYSDYLPEGQYIKKYKGEIEIYNGR